MTDSTILCDTLNDIIGKNNMPKIIIIGGGGLGKTTLTNRITNAKFSTSGNTNDGTVDFQGAPFSRNGIDTLFIDSPGFHYNEDKWWNGVLQIKNIIGVIVMHKYEMRNSGYGNFGYVLAYLNKQEKTKVLKFVLDYSEQLHEDNYMYDSTSVKNSDHNDIYDYTQAWMWPLNQDGTIEIFSPVALIDQYHGQLKETSRLQSEMQQLKEGHAKIVSEHVQHIDRLRIEIETILKEKDAIKNDYEDITNTLDNLPQQLASYENATGGYVPDAPHKRHYLWSWLPFFGAAYLHSLRTKAEKDHALAMNLCRHMGKKKKR